MIQPADIGARRFAHQACRAGFHLDDRPPIHPADIGARRFAHQACRAGFHLDRNIARSYRKGQSLLAKLRWDQLP